MGDTLKKIYEHIDGDFSVKIKEDKNDLYFVCSNEANEIYKNKFLKIDLDPVEINENLFSWKFSKKNVEAVTLVSKIISEDNIEDLYKYKKIITPQKPNVFEKKIVWTNDVSDKFLVDYSEKSFVFFGPKDFTDNYEEFSGCLNGWFEWSKGKKKPGFCFSKSHYGSIDFMNKIISEEDGSNIDIRNLLFFVTPPEKKPWKKYDQQPTQNTVQEKKFEIEGVPKAPKIPMDIFFNITLQMEGKYVPNENLNDLFEDLINIMEQKSRVLKTKDYPNGCMCFYGTSDEVDEKMEEYLENDSSLKEYEQWYIKNEFVLNKNKIVIIDKDINQRISLKTKKISNNKIILSGTVKQVEKALVKYSDPENDEIYNEKYTYMLDDMKISFLEKE